MIYFDNAATSFLKPNVVKQTVFNSINTLTANPGRSGHRLSQNVAEKVFETRQMLKSFFHAEDYSVIFTKNCTEALNLAILGMLKPGDKVITTCYEHNSVLRPLEMLKDKGIEVVVIDCDLKVFHNHLPNVITDNTKMVITTHVSNVTGDICDIEKVGKICKNYNIKYLVDGAQSSGHLNIDLTKCNVDMFAFAGHKGLLSLTGVGGLLVKENVSLTPIIFGGTGTNSEDLMQPQIMPEGFESGTVPSISIISLNASVKYLSKNFDKIIKREKELSRYLYNKLKDLQFIELYSTIDSNNVFSFNFKQHDSVAVANMLDEKYDICVRSGLHCAPLIHKKLKTIETGAVRVSIDFNNTYKEIDYLIFALKEMATL